SRILLANSVSEEPLPRPLPHGGWNTPHDARTASCGGPFPRQRGDLHGKLAGRQAQAPLKSPLSPWGRGRGRGSLASEFANSILRGGRQFAHLSLRDRSGDELVDGDVEED